MNNNPSPNRTPNGQQRPPVQGQRPIQGQRPPMQGQRPIQGQQRPPMQGQRPPMQGQRPVQGQRPPMQGQRPPMQGQRPQNYRPAPKKSNKTLIIAIVAVLVLAIIGGLIALTVTLVNNGNNSSVSNSGGSSGGKKPSGGSSTTPPEDNGPQVEAGITLPSATQVGTSINYSDPATEISGISSAAAVLVDMNTGNAIAGKNADVRIHPASMTKVMTLLVACEKAQNAGKLLTVEQWMEDYRQSTGASGNLGFVAGDQISVESALYLINYRSDTIACLLIAQYIAGNEADFVSLMNQKAADLGLKDTHFVNTTGLQDPNHYTTCREMAIIMNAAMNNPTASKIITSYVGTTIDIYNGYEDGNTTPYRQPTIYSSWYSDRLRDNPRINSNITVIGGKTGYEDIPTSCFVTVAKNSANGKQYICVNVGRIDETQNEVSSSQSTKDSITIYKNYAK